MNVSLTTAKTKPSIPLDVKITSLEKMIQLKVTRIKSCKGQFLKLSDPSHYELAESIFKSPCGDIVVPKHKVDTASPGIVVVKQTNVDTDLSADNSPKPCAPGSTKKLAALNAGWQSAASKFSDALTKLNSTVPDHLQFTAFLKEWKPNEPSFSIDQILTNLTQIEDEYLSIQYNLVKSSPQIVTAAREAIRLMNTFISTRKEKNAGIKTEADTILAAKLFVRALRELDRCQKTYGRAYRNTERPYARYDFQIKNLHKIIYWEKSFREDLRNLITEYDNPFKPNTIAESAAQAKRLAFNLKKKILLYQKTKILADAYAPHANISKTLDNIDRNVRLNCAELAGCLHVIAIYRDYYDDELISKFIRSPQDHHACLGEIITKLKEIRHRKGDKLIDISIEIASYSDMLLKERERIHSPKLKSRVPPPLVSYASIAQSLPENEKYEILLQQARSASQNLSMLYRLLDETQP